MNQILSYSLIALTSAAILLLLIAGPLGVVFREIDARIVSSAEWSVGGAISNCVSAVIGGGSCCAKAFTPVELVVECRGGEVSVWDNETEIEFSVEFPVEVELLSGDVYPWHPDSKVALVRGVVSVSASWVEDHVALRVGG